MAQHDSVQEVQGQGQVRQRPVTPLLAVDGIIVYREQFFIEKIVLIQRKNEPKGLALPGGFVDVGETVEDAFNREMREEIGIRSCQGDFFGIYSDPKRDPRQHVVSIVFSCVTQVVPTAGDDAKEIVLVPLNKLTSILPQLVFDHAHILADWLVKNERSQNAP
jgi:8-oxo-dGTP diphosphatase